MSDKPMPRPITATDFYLAAILDELKAIAQRPVQTAVVPDLVDIREPAVAGTPLPEGFPGRDALIAAGITTWEAIPRDGDSLVDIKGIRKVTAGQILAELSD